MPHWHNRGTDWRFHGSAKFGGRGEQTDRRRGSGAHHTTAVGTSLPNVVSSSATKIVTLIMEEVEIICCIMLQLEAPTITSTSFAHSGKLNTCCASCNIISYPKIIDPMASDHMMICQFVVIIHCLFR